MKPHGTRPSLKNLILCKAVTKKGGRCKKTPMKWSKYCYLHSFGHFKNVPLWKNSTVHTIVGILTTLIISIIFFVIGPSKSNQEEMKEILYDMKAASSAERERLLNKYPSGYLIFATDYSGLFTPPNSNLLNNYKLNWSNVKIVFLKDNAISFLLPYIAYEPVDKSANLVYDNLLTKIPLGAPGTTYPFPIDAPSIPDNIFIEIISYTKNGIIMCIGFRDKSLGNIPN